jgi:hypothetical protein
MILAILVIILALGVIFAAWAIPELLPAWKQQSSVRIAENVALIVVGLGLALIGIQRKHYWMITIGVFAVAAAVFALVDKDRNLGPKIAVTATAGLAIVAGITSTVLKQESQTGFYPLAEGATTRTTGTRSRNPSFSAMRAFEKGYVDDDIKQRLANAVLMVEKLHEMYPDYLDLLNLRQPRLDSGPCESLLRHEIQEIVKYFTGNELPANFKYMSDPEKTLDYNRLEFQTQARGQYSQVDTGKSISYSISTTFERDENPYQYVARIFKDLPAQKASKKAIVVPAHKMEFVIGILASRLVQYQLSPFFPINFGFGFTNSRDYPFVQFSENRGEMTLLSFLDLNLDQLNQETIKSLFMQIILALGALSCALGVVHNDLHFNNILVKKVDEGKKMYFKLSPDPLCINDCSQGERTREDSQRSRIYEIPTYGAEITIIDFGLCSMVHNNTKYKTAISSSDPITDVKWALKQLVGHFGQAQDTFGLKPKTISQLSYKQIMERCLNHYSHVESTDSVQTYPVLYPRPREPLRETGAGGLRDTGAGGVRDTGAGGLRETGAGGLREPEAGGVREPEAGGLRETGAGGLRETGAGGVREPEAGAGAAVYQFEFKDKKGQTINLVPERGNIVRTVEKDVEQDLDTLTVNKLLQTLKAQYQKWDDIYTITIMYNNVLGKNEILKPGETYTYSI